MPESVPDPAAPDPRPSSPWDYPGVVGAQPSWPVPPGRSVRPARLLWTGPAAAALAALVGVFVPWGTVVYHTGDGQDFAVTGSLLTQAEIGEHYMALGIAMVAPLGMALLAVLALAIAAVCGARRFDRVVVAAAAGAALCELGVYMYLREIPRPGNTPPPSLGISVGGWLGFAGSVVAVVLAVVALRAARAERGAVGTSGPESSRPYIPIGFGSAVGMAPGAVGKGVVDTTVRAAGAALTLAAFAMVFLPWAILSSDGFTTSVYGFEFDQFAAVPALACLLGSALLALPRFSRVSAWRRWRFGVACAALGCLAAMLLSIVVANLATAILLSTPYSFGPGSYLGLIFAFAAAAASWPRFRRSQVPAWAPTEPFGAAPPVDPGPDETTQS